MRLTRGTDATMPRLKMLWTRSSRRDIAMLRTGAPAALFGRQSTSPTGRFNTISEQADERENWSVVFALPLC
jgi:hypothetical protein